MYKLLPAGDDFDLSPYRDDLDKIAHAIKEAISGNSFQVTDMLKEQVASQIERFLADLSLDISLPLPLVNCWSPTGWRMDRNGCITLVDDKGNSRVFLRSDIYRPRRKARVRVKKSVADFSSWLFVEIPRHSFPLH